MTSTAAPLARDFYDRETVDVARDLIGQVLVYRAPEGSLAGRIVETEAYGPADPANHAFRGETARNRAMFGPPGTVYIYRIYGLHWCLNAVTRPEGVGEAVLIRALEPIVGLDIMQRNRGTADPRLLCSGPSRLCAAMGITGALDGTDLLNGPLLMTAEGGLPGPITATTRIGITKGADLPWRFCAADSPFLSRRPSATIPSPHGWGEG